jgi:hypothetical protein
VNSAATTPVWSDRTKEVELIRKPALARPI